MRRALYRLQYVTKAFAWPLLTRLANAARRTPRRLPAHLRAAERDGYPATDARTARRQPTALIDYAKLEAEAREDLQRIRDSLPRPRRDLPYAMFFTIAAMALGLSARPAVAQRPVDLLGTWRIENASGQGPREVVIRGDSSVTWGKESSRWLLRGEHLAVALGGEWEVYRVRVGRDVLSLSGGELQKPVTLRRVGPPTSRPAGRRMEPHPDIPPRWPG